MSPVASTTRTQQGRGSRLVLEPSFCMLMELKNFLGQCLISSFFSLLTSCFPLSLSLRFFSISLSWLPGLEGTFRETRRRGPYRSLVPPPGRKKGPKPVSGHPSLPPTNRRGPARCVRPEILRRPTCLPLVLPTGAAGLSSSSSACFSFLAFCFRGLGSQAV